MKLSLFLITLTLSLYLISTEQNKDFTCTNYLKSNETTSQSIIAIAFYGMSRNLKLTLPSIKHRVFNVLTRSNILYDVFWHTLITSEIHHLRVDKEYGPINPYDVRLVNPCRFSLSDQNLVHMQEFKKFQIARNLRESNKVTHNLYDNWMDNYYSTKNILGAFYTLNSVYELILSYSMSKSIKYDAILVIRPDTAMVKDIDLPLHINVIKHNAKNNMNMIWIPDFEHYGGYNDRGAYGNIAAMEIYMKRGIFYRDQYLNDTNGEQFLKYYLNKYSITVKMSLMRLLRVRQNNLIARNDRDYKVLNLLENDFDLLNCMSNATDYYLLPTC